MKTAQGFTLVELLVAVSIVAILSLVGLVIFTEVQKNGRDAKRRSDIDTIASALESKYNTLSATPYPAADGNLFTTGILPAPPSGTTETTYVFYVNASDTANTWVTNSVTGVRYKVCALLEKATGNSTKDTTTGVYSYVATNAGTHYCKGSQQ